MNALLQVVVVRRPGSGFAAEAETMIRRAFGSDPDEPAASGGFSRQSVWDGVRVIAVTDQSKLEALKLAENDRVLWVLLVDYPMTDGAEWPSIMGVIGQQLDAATQIPEQNRIGILLMGEPSALERLPDTLRNLQGKPQAQLGEHRMGPHRLALLALHRARLLLGRTPGTNALRLFISHAKADGIFFADALNSAVKQVPELDTWYDAEDIRSGVSWKRELKDNASRSVFIAIRTETYCQRPTCVDEFRWALEQGVPIVVVDALLRPDIAPAQLPFASMPTVRVPDGNTHRVLASALREHLRVLLVETCVAEASAVNAPGLPASAWRIWPRLPAFHALQELVSQQILPTPRCIVIADASGPEINAAVNVLRNLRNEHGQPVPLLLATAETFGAYAVQLAAAFQPPPPTTAPS